MASLKIIQIDEKVFFLSFNQSDDEDILVEQFLDEKGSVMLTDGVSVWRGEVCAADVSRFAAETSKDVASIKQLCYDALCDVPLHAVFAYELAKEESNCRLNIKKLIAESLKFQFCTIPLKMEADPHASLSLLLQSVIRQLTQCKEKLQSANCLNEHLGSEKDLAVKKAEELVNAKENLERDLYGKFAAVLNAKKSKIRDLKEQVNSRSELVAPTESKHRDDGSDAKATDDDETTDDERNPTPLEPPIKRQMSSRDSPDVLLPDSQPEEAQPAAQRRGRPRKMRSKQATSSALPRTTSLPRPSRQERATTQNSSETASTVRRTSSRRSATPSLDLDALMDQL